MASRSDAESLIESKGGGKGGWRESLKESSSGEKENLQYRNLGLGIILPLLLGKPYLLPLLQVSSRYFWS